MAVRSTLIVVTLATLAASSPGALAVAEVVPLPHAGDLALYAISAAGRSSTLELAWLGEDVREDRFGVARTFDLAAGRAENLRFEFAFERGTAVPASRATESPVTTTDESPLTPQSSRVVMRESVFADLAGSPEACLLRALWQGAPIDALDGADLYALCPAARPPGASATAPLRFVGDAAWSGRAARVFEASLDETSGLVLARFAFADGVAFPVGARFESADAAVEYELRNVEPGAGPFPGAPGARAPEQRPDAAFSPLGRWGVVEGDPSEYLFPPSEAIAAIERSAFGYPQYASDHPAARVVAYRYFENEHDSPVGSGAIPAWTFLFNDESGQGFEVTVRRAPLVRPVGLVDLDAGGVAHQVETARVTLPPLDVSTLPARVMSTPDMIAAWKALAGPGAPAPNRIAARLQPDLKEASEPGLPGRDAFVGYLAFGADVAVTQPAAPSWDEVTVESGLVIDAATGGAVRAFDRRADSSTWLAPLAPELATAAPVGSPIAGEGRAVLILLPVAAGATLLALALRFAWAFYTRLPSEGVMRNRRRAAILDLVATEPGVHLSALRERTGLGGGALAYHLAVLERSGRVSRVKSQGYVRFFPAGALNPGAMRERAALLAGSHARIMQAVNERPGIAQRDLAAMLGVSRVAIHRAASRLEAAGLVRCERAGRARVLWPRAHE